MMNREMQVDETGLDLFARETPYQTTFACAPYSVARARASEEPECHAELLY